MAVLKGKEGFIISKAVEMGFKIVGLSKFYLKVKGSLSRRGLLGFILLALRMAVSPLWWENKFLMFHVRIKDPYRIVEVKDVEFSELDPLDYEELVEFSPLFSRRQMQKRLAIDHRCYISKLDNRIVFHTWMGAGKFYLPELGKEIDLSEDTVFFYNTFTDPEYRHRRILPAFTTRVHQFLSEMGCSCFITIVNTQAHLPIRAYTKLVGAHKITFIRYKRIMGFKRYSKREVTIEEADRLSRGRKGRK